MQILNCVCRIAIFGIHTDLTDVGSRAIDTHRITPPGPVDVLSHAVDVDLPQLARGYPDARVEFSALVTDFLGRS